VGGGGCEVVVVGLPAEGREAIVHSGFEGCREVRGRRGAGVGKAKVEEPTGKGVGGEKVEAAAKARKGNVELEVEGGKP
jgi:hypothetical protein